MQNPVSLLLSPFGENISGQWVGGTLFLLFVLVIGSQALTLAGYRSRRMYLVSAAFLFLAAILIAPFADSLSPRELHRRLMQPQTLGMLSMLQILWTSVTVFASAKTEFDKKKKVSCIISDTFPSGLSPYCPLRSYSFLCCISNKTSC